jgi:hypothetical protein
MTGLLASVLAGQAVSRLGESNPRPTHYEKHGKPLWTRYLHR